MNHACLFPAQLFFHQFEPVSITVLTEVFRQMKRSGFPVDVIPAWLFKEDFPSTGTSVLAITISSITSSVAPDGFKHAIIL